MIVDSASSELGDRLEAEICVVGAGPAGGIIASELARRGVHVVVLEAGDDDMDSAGPGDGEVDGLPYPLESSRLMALGGSANLWHVENPDGPVSVRLRPLNGEHFAHRPWIPHSGWPFDADHLAPYHDRAMEHFGLDGVDYGVPGDLGADDFVEGYRPGVMRFGPRSAITDVQRNRLAGAETVTVVTRAHVVTIEAGTDSRVRRVVARTPGGRDLSVEASRFVLAMGAIENARALLLMAGPDGDGVVNRNDVVGRYFMEHPHRLPAFIRTRSPLLEQFDQLAGRIGDTPGEIWFFTDPGEAERQGIASLGVAIRGSGPKAFARGRWLDHPADGDGPFGRLWRDALRRDSSPAREELLRAAVSDPLPAARHLARRLIAALDARRVARTSDPTDRFYSTMIMAEHVPDASNRVTLSSTKDALGLPRARLELALDDLTLRSIRTNHENFVSALRRRAPADVHSRVPHYRSGVGFTWGYHHMGTTRMDADPSKGVVDADSRVHELENLYVAGSSVFPTSGVSNPTLTLGALAVRLADHLQRLTAGTSADETRQRKATSPDG